MDAETEAGARQLSCVWIGPHDSSAEATVAHFIPRVTGEDDQFCLSLAVADNQNSNVNSKILGVGAIGCTLYFGGVPEMHRPSDSLHALLLLQYIWPWVSSLPTQMEGTSKPCSVNIDKG